MRERRLAELAVCAMLAACTPRAPFGDDRAPLADGGSGGPPPSGTLADLAPGQSRNLGRYECTDLEGSGYPCQSIDEWSRFVYDQNGHRLLWFGGGEHATPRTDVAELDLDAPVWQSAYPPTPCADMTPDNADLVRGAWRNTGHPMSRQTYDMLVMSDSTSEMVMLTYGSPGTDCRNWPADAPDLDAVPGRIAHYSPEARAWRYSSAAANTWAFDAAAEFDPVSGSILVLSDRGLWTYDPRNEAVAQRLSFDDGARLGYSAELVYYPPSDRFYHFTRPGLLFEVVPDRNDWSRTMITEITNATGTRPATGAKGWAYDAQRRTLGGGIRDSVFYELDPEARAWRSSVVPGNPGDVSFFTLAFDARAGVYVFFTDWQSGYSTWAYRP